MQTKLTESKCASCGHILDTATGVEEGTTPSVNDLTVCVYCGELHRFDEDLKLVLLTEEEIEEIKDQAPDVWNTLSSAQSHIKALRGHE